MGAARAARPLALFAALRAGLRAFSDALGGGVPSENTGRDRTRSADAARQTLDAPLAPAAIAFADLDEQRRLRAEAEAGRRRAAFLAEASAALASSLDYEQTMAAMARMAVPHISDWCVVDMMGDDGVLRRVAVAHVDPEKVEFARDVQRRYPPDPKAQAGAYAVVRTGRAQVVNDLTDVLIESAARDDEHRRLLKQLQPRGFMCVPLRTREGTVGAITFVSAESGRTYDGTDLALAEALASRAAVAIDNAKLFREAQQANRLKDEFLATLSHELRSPLTAVLGWTHLLRTGALDENARQRALETVERNAQAQARLVDELLDVSRIITGKLPLTVHSVELPSVIDAVVQSLGPAADAKQIAIRTVLDREVAPVAGDPDRLQQIVWNIVSNAVKFTPAGGGVDVRLERVNGSLALTIADTGAGIDPAFLPHVFERFRQADATTTRDHAGLGLGLAITRHLVELHGGTITAASEGRGEGATFTVTLPIRAVTPAHMPAAVLDAAPRPAAGGRVEPSRLDGITILAVDDDPDTRELLEAILSRQGAEIRVASSAREAYRIFAEWRPAVLLADIEMPGEDGYSLVRRIRALTGREGVSVIAMALTAYARAEDRVRALSAGFQFHLAKPVDPIELTSVIASLAGKRQL